MATLRRARRARRRARRRRDGLQRIRPRPAGRAAGDPGGDRAHCWRRVAAAGRPARAGHQRADARADRSGALHRQPLQRPAGPRHRRRAGRPRRARRRWSAGRSRSPIRPASWCARGDRAADAGRLPGGAAGRCRGLRRRGRRLAGGQRGRAARSRRARRGAAGAGAGAQPRHPRHHRRPPARAARAWWSASPRRPTTCAPTPQAKRARKGCDWIVANDVSPGNRHHGRRRERGASDHRRRHRGLAAPDQGRGRRRASPQRIAAALA